jgi:hypothetical protein
MMELRYVREGRVFNVIDFVGEPYTTLTGAHETFYAQGTTIKSNINLKRNAKVCKGHTTLTIFVHGNAGRQGLIHPIRSIRRYATPVVQTRAWPVGLAFACYLSA